ncbi:UPF0764 protein C16orf89 homolog [Lineus longissimus]|uniref:UPF0764 protein C16orf89 homolog n=1 Tax=Lineus longissimus TaxID=88925 RepID=UPI00315D6978
MIPKTGVPAFSFFVFLACTGVVLSGVQGTANDLETNDVLNSMGKLLDYLKANFKDLNVDGLFGLRIAQGQILAALAEAKKGDFKLAPSIREKVDELVQVLNQLCEGSFRHIMAGGTAYSQRFKSIIFEPMSGIEGIYHVNDVLPKVSFNCLKNNIAHYNENAGDACFSLILGTAKYMDKMTFPKCTVSQRCVDNFLGEEALKTMTGYFPTHSALYVYLARKNGCAGKIQAHLNRPLTRVMADICSKAYAEAKLLVHHFRFMDLFMETIVVCGGLSGFEEFYRRDWWDLVKFGQDQTGCYTMTLSAYGILRESYEKTLTDHPPSSHSRKLRRDVEMSDGCSSHTTGMAAAVVGSYARYLMEHGGHFERE